jgi:hypothetical protein
MRGYIKCANALQYVFTLLEKLIPHYLLSRATVQQHGGMISPALKCRLGKLVGCMPHLYSAVRSHRSSLAFCFAQEVSWSRKYNILLAT